MYQTYAFNMAEKEGFEPSRPVTSLRAFQARPFSHLGISPLKMIITTKDDNVIRLSIKICAFLRAYNFSKVNIYKSYLSDGASFINVLTFNYGKVIF